MKFKPRAYQPPAIAHLTDVPFAALWADMGLGKTVSALTATARLIDTLEVHRTLVVAPLRVATMVWAQEAAKWQHLRHLPVQLIRHPDPRERLRQCFTDAAIHVINYDLLKWLVQALGGKWLWDHVILDEASKIKDPNAWRSRALWHVRPRIRKMEQLTGTPAPNGLEDLFGQVLMLDKGQRLGRTKGMYLRRWFRQADRDARKWEPIDGALESITEQLRDICFTLRAKDYLDLPPLITNEVRVALSGPIMKQYRRLERDMWLQLERGVIDSANAAVATGKCLQFANGAVWLDDEDERRWHHVHDAKLEALEEVIESAGGEPVLVAYQYQHDRERLLKAFPQAEVLDNNPETEARWNRGEIPILLAHPKSAGHGLNLQGGGRHIAFFSLTWSLEDFEQIIERLGPTRQLQAGTPRPVYVHLLIADGTVDELVHERLTTRASVQDILRRAMRRQAS